MLIRLMPVKHTLRVALSKPLVRYVRDKVVAGHYATVSEVVRESLRALMDRDETAKPKAHPSLMSTRTSNG